jgi:hypothetical protein
VIRALFCDADQDHRFYKLRRQTTRGRPLRDIQQSDKYRRYLEQGRAAILLMVSKVPLESETDVTKPGAEAWNVWLAKVDSRWCERIL